MQGSEHFHLLSFEGPDGYARAGGIASRVTGLAGALADAGHDTHLWFVGDPNLPGREEQGKLTLHRWCQWVSAHHPAGVYDGEDGKCNDYGASLPPVLLDTHIRPSIARGQRSVVLAEEWHTVNAVLHLDWLLRREGLRDRVSMMWNANNTFGFDRIDWSALSRAATICTVSRYMKHRMTTWGVEAVVIPNGLGPESFAEVDQAGVDELRTRVGKRLLLGKIARWDPDKRWLLAIDTVAELKKRHVRPLLVARGGVEAHEQDVIQRARAHGLRVVERKGARPGVRSFVESMDDSDSADVVVLRSHLDPAARGVLFRGSDAMLANSSHEPFGLVGLEAMAAGGLVCTGASGEDYAVDGENAIVLQQNDPSEFVSLFERAALPERNRGLRLAGQRTARAYAWPRVVERALAPRI